MVGLRHGCIVMLINLRPRRHKPTFGSVEIDWSHPLARGLEACWIFNSSGGTVYDLVGRHHGTITDTAVVTWSIGTRGLAINSIPSLSTTRGIIIANPVVIASGAPFSFDTMTTWATGDLYGTLLAQGAARGFYQHETGSNAGKMDFFNVGDTPSTTATAVNTTNHFVLTSTGTSAIYYLNGTMDGIAQSHTAVSLSLDTMFNDSASDTFAGKCFFQRVWTRVLTVSEARWLADEPYAFLRPRLAITNALLHGTFAATATTVFRRTLSAHGTRTGSRQVHF